ncbi:MAG: tRNA pseudouridine(55) synthase TruB [Roseburia sp.]|nr:tRNA pseudouridine(55) synthase TruB [Roseburia sp.]
MDGIINVYKEKGFTSHDVVAKLRGILHQKKIGHTGTLDPDATGVLPVCIGKATKVCELLTDRSKSYTAVVKLGIVTDTQDMTGTVIREQEAEVNLEEIKEAAAGFTGEIWQTPPMYSAVKVNGKRLYELARQGIEVERKKRKITVYSCEVTEYHPETKEFTMEVTCSKGTYIRTLCHEIGEALSCGACMASLVRTAVEPFSLSEAHTLSQIEEFCQAGRLEEILMPVDGLFENFPKVIVSAEGLRYLRNGNVLGEELCEVSAPASHGSAGYSSACDGSMVRMYDAEGRFYALYRYDSSRSAFINEKMFFNHIEG